MPTAVHNSYTNKSARQRRKREVRRVMNDVEGFCQRKTNELRSGMYKVGKYRHFRLRDKKKERDISVLPYEDRCVQNDAKDAIQPLLLRNMTDDMLGGLPGRGVLVNGHYGVVSRMRELMNDASLTHYIQGDVAKFYDNIDNIIAMRTIERNVTDKRTLALIRQHLFNQKKLAIGDPFSHLIANAVMSIIIRSIKTQHPNIRLVNFADDVFIASNSKAELTEVRKTMKDEASKLRLHFHRLYVRPMPSKGKTVTFCGYKFGRGYVKLTQRTKKRYIKARHSERSMGSYNGMLQVADTKHLRQLTERNYNRHMSEKIRRPFAGRPMKIETLEGISHTIVDMAVKTSRQKDSDSYMHVQAIADGLGLVVYSTGSAKICEYLKTKSKHDLPLRDMKIVHDWSGFYYDGTVYTDAEEEEMIRKQFNIPK